MSKKWDIGSDILCSVDRDRAAHMRAERGADMTDINAKYANDDWFFEEDDDDEDDD